MRIGLVFFLVLIFLCKKSPALWKCINTFPAHHHVRQVSKGQDFILCGDCVRLMAGD